MNKQPAGGFTLIESIVSIAVLVLLATFLLSASINARRNTAARIGAEQFAGFLRETAALAVNGVKDQFCNCSRQDPSCTRPREDPRCSQYAVGPVSGNERAYTRQSVFSRDAGSPPAVTRTLPQGARFGAAGALTFSFLPPTLTAVGPRTTEVAHVSGTPVWNICVAANGTVEVRHDAC